MIRYLCNITRRENHWGLLQEIALQWQTAKWTVTTLCFAAGQTETAVTTYFASRLLLLFEFA